jgi:hypothetical protein
MSPEFTEVEWTPEERAAFEARRRSRNIALGSVLVALALLFYGITVVRMAPGIKDPALTTATRPPPQQMPSP